MTTSLALLIGALGLVAIYGAVTNKNPWDLLVQMADQSRTVRKID